MSADRATRRPRSRKSTRTRSLESELQQSEGRKLPYTARAQARFLREFVQTGNVKASALAAKVGRRTIYDWVKDDPVFARLYQEAKDDAIDLLEAEARRRAVDGVLEPVYQGGKKVGVIRKYSDTLMALFLKGYRREVFSERFEHTGPKGAPLSFTLNLDARDRDV
jgi:hypothetical protein